MMKNILLFLMVITLIPRIVFADGVDSFNATVDRQTVPLGQSITLTLEITGSAQNIPRPELPKIPDFRIYSAGQSSNIRIVNGAVTSSIQYKYGLTPQKEGKLQVPSLTLTYQKKKYSTKPIPITVTKGNSPAASQQTTPQTKQRGNFFVEMLVDKPTAYVNEQITLIFRFYRARTSNVFGNISYTPPETEGFWTQDLPPEKQYYTNVDGRNYLVTELRTALFPTSSGEYTISEATAEIPGGFFQRGSRLKTNPVKVKVLPLPTKGKPANFSGAVGKFKMTATIDNKVPQANDPISLKVKISGQGNIETITLPKIGELSNFKSYDSGSSTNTSTDNYIVSGVKTYEKVLIPKRTGTYTIPAMELSYFDPKTKIYKTSSTNPITINVAGFSNSDDSRLPVRQEVRQLAKDILYIKPVPEKIENKDFTIYDNKLIWLISVLPVLALFFSLYYHHHREKLETDMGYARYHRATKMAKQRLKTANDKLEMGAVAEFYGEVHKSIYKYIADKTNVPTARFTSSDSVSQFLQEKSFPDEVISRTKNILEQCEIARFAPTEIKAEGQEEILSQAEKIIVDLDKHF